MLLSNVVSLDIENKSLLFIAVNPKYKRYPGEAGSVLIIG